MRTQTTLIVLTVLGTMEIAIYKDGTGWITTDGKDVHDVNAGDIVYLKGIKGCVLAKHSDTWDYSLPMDERKLNVVETNNFRQLLNSLMPESWRQPELSNLN